nr:hypothetical protein [Tanacetum cinerariifolium]
MGAEVLARSNNQPQTSYAVAASMSEFDLKKILIDKMETNKSINISDIQKNLYNALIETYNSDKDIFTLYGDVVTLKRGRDDQDKDEDPSTGSDRGTKRRKSSKDAEPSKGLKSKESKLSSSSEGTQSQHKSFDYVMNCLNIENLTQKILVWPAFNLLKDTCKSFIELEFHFKECYKAVNDRLDWHNPEGYEYPCDLSKPLPLIEDQRRQVVPVDYFINNDLKYLKGGSSSSKYATSIIRTKAAKYNNIEGIEDMVPRLWSPMKVAYNKHAFKQGDFQRLNLRDIEDMILLLVQIKLSNLDVDDRYDLGLALRMFSKRIVILHYVKDLQLGVESYQKKLNITRPETIRSHIMVKAIDKLLFKRRLMRNLEKFVGGRDYGNDLRLLERTI